MVFVYPYRERALYGVYLRKNNFQILISHSSDITPPEMTNGVIPNGKLSVLNGRKEPIYESVIPRPPGAEAPAKDPAPITPPPPPELPPPPPQFPEQLPPQLPPENNG